MGESIANHALKNKIVELNIGGLYYITTVGTLCPKDEPNFFSGLLSERWANPVDSKGAYFIDRNGKNFEPILDYLRTGKWVIPPHLVPETVLSEARFYGFEPLPFRGISDLAIKDYLNQAQQKEDEKLMQEEVEKSGDSYRAIIENILPQLLEAAKRGKKNKVCSPWYLPNIEKVRAVYIAKKALESDFESQISKLSVKTQCIFDSTLHSALKEICRDSASMSLFLKYIKTTNLLTISVEKEELYLELNNYNFTRNHFTYEIGIGATDNTKTSLHFNAYRIFWAS